MTKVGSGGVAIGTLFFSKRFKRDYNKLDKALRELVDAQIKDLMCNPRPPGLRFEKLSGWRNPDIYTIHATGNYKISWR